MGAIKRIGKFGLGGLIGSAIGVAGGLLIAPDSGSATQKNIRDRIQAAKVAGADAQAAKERELIDRYRLGTNAAGALTEAEIVSKHKHDEQLKAIHAGG